MILHLLMVQQQRLALTHSLFFYNHNFQEYIHSARLQSGNFFCKRALFVAGSFAKDTHTSSRVVTQCEAAQRQAQLRLLLSLLVVQQRGPAPVFLVAIWHIHLTVRQRRRVHPCIYLNIHNIGTSQGDNNTRVKRMGKGETREGGREG